MLEEICQNYTCYKYDTICCWRVIMLNKYSNVLGITPRSSCWKLSASSEGPSMVKVLPEPVCPLKQTYTR